MCRWKRFSTGKKESTLFSFVSSSPDEGLVLVSRSTREKLYAKLSELTYKSGISPEDVTFQFEGNWENELSLEEVDAELSDAKEDCARPSGELLLT